jgi:hypothetical protein
LLVPWQVRGAGCGEIRRVRAQRRLARREGDAVMRIRPRDQITRTEKKRKEKKRKEKKRKEKRKRKKKNKNKKGYYEHFVHLDYQEKLFCQTVLKNYFNSLSVSTSQVKP